MALTAKQGVKINAALSMIYARGYDAQTVVNWARTYQRSGHDIRRSYEKALSDFVGGQPDLGPVLGKVTRLVEASDDTTVARYGAAIQAYIETGDDSAIAALGPMIARDSVALAVKNGELEDGAVTAESVEAAIGFAMEDTFVAAGAEPEAPPPEQATATQATPPIPPDPSPVAQKPNQPRAGEAQVSPYGAGGRVANQARMNATPDTGALGPTRTLLEGRVNATPSDGAQTYTI